METFSKIGIMGGTFNPIHNGHLMLAQAAYEMLTLDKVLFMPSGTSYLKRGVLDSSKRAEMVQRAIQGMPQFELSRMEVDRIGNTYTYETLSQLKGEQPQNNYFFIVGADSLCHMENWVHPEVIFALATIVCAVRDEINISDIKQKGMELQRNFGAVIQYMDIPKIPISSTQIRQAVKSHMPIDELVPQSVAFYIQQERLYEED